MGSFYFTLFLTPVYSHTIHAPTPNTPHSHTHPHTHAHSNNKQPLRGQQQQQANVLSTHGDNNKQLKATQLDHQDYCRLQSEHTGNIQTTQQDNHSLGRAGMGTTLAKQEEKECRSRNACSYYLAFASSKCYVMQKKDKNELHFSFLSYVDQREMRHFPSAPRVLGFQGASAIEQFE